jgi:ankyrin repeat protein
MLDHERNLIAAVADGDIELIEILFNKYECNVNLQDQFGVSLLLRAVKRNDITISEYLLGHGANPMLPDQRGETPLQWAERHNNKDLIEMLQNASTRLSFK